MIKNSSRRSNDQAVLSVSVDIEVPFHDVDAMAVCWHGHYVKYFELARCKLLRKLDYDYPKMQSSGYLWPVIDLQVRYIQAARYGDALQVAASLAEWENRIKIDYRIMDGAGRRISRGHTVQVAVKADSGELLLATPDVWQQRVLKFLKDESP